METKTGARKLLLKPASFNQNQITSENGNSQITNPEITTQINNPFLKCEKEDQVAAQTSPDEPEKDSSNLFKPATNLFASHLASAGGNSFVFGQNLHDRVIIDNVNAASADKDTNKKSDDSSDLFSSALTPAKSSEEETASDENNSPQGDTQTVPTIIIHDENKEKVETISSDNNMSLVEAARKYEEMRGAQKRKYEEVEITTGEEDERNILEINCKLFTFIENNYEERGRGILRLNDSKEGSRSRVVFRASGSLRLLLNTKVWRDQVCEQPSSKSMRLTAFDTSGVIKIYLVMGRVEDVGHLYRALSSRIRKEKDRSPDCDTEEEQKDDDDEEVAEPKAKRAASE